MKETDSLFAVPLEGYTKKASDLTGLNKVLAQSIEKVDGWQYVFGKLSRRDFEPLPDEEEDDDPRYFDLEVEEGKAELEECHHPDGSSESCFEFEHLGNYLKLFSIDDGGSILACDWDCDKMWHKYDTSPGDYDIYGDGWGRELCFEGYILIAFRTSEKVKYQGENPFACKSKFTGKAPAHKKRRVK